MKVMSSSSSFRVAMLGMAVLAFLPPLPAQTNFATLVPDGAWTGFNDPRALFHHGVLYVGHVRSDGRTALAAFDPAKGVGTNLWTSSLAEFDDHNNPGLLVKQDGRLLAIHARHGTDQFFCYRLSISTNPASPLDWGPEQRIPATGAELTYANPFQLAAEAGQIYNFCRDLNLNPTVLTSTDGGSSWSSPAQFIKTGPGRIRPYVKYCSNYTNRIDFLYTDGHPRERDVNNSLYHAYYQAGALHRTDGSLLKSFSNLPLLHGAGERGTVIYQYSKAATADPNDHLPTGRAWCWEIAYQTNGWPVCVFTVQRDQVMGTNWFNDRIYYYYARWTGTNWQKRFIAQAGRPLYESERDYAGGICLDPQDPNILYLSSNAAEPFNLGSTTNVQLRANERYEISRGVTTDGGLSFKWTHVTMDSAQDNLRPYVPRWYGSAPAVIWLRGTYRNYTSYDCSIVGLFSQPVPNPLVALATDAAGASALPPLHEYLEYPSRVNPELRLFASFECAAPTGILLVKMHGWHGQVKTAHRDNVPDPAAREYFVIEPEMRGRGDATGNPDCNGWELQDVIDAVEFAKTHYHERISSPQIVLLWGGSGGGGNVYALLGKFPDYFSAAIVEAGMSDYALWHLLDRTGEFRDELEGVAGKDPRGLKSWIGGTPETNAEAYRSRGGLTTVGNLLTPTLIFHGADDVRVPALHARLWAGAAQGQGRGALVTYHELAGVGHDLYAEESKEQQAFHSRTIEAFLRTHREPPVLPPKGSFIVAGYLKTARFEVALDSIDHVAQLEYNLPAKRFILRTATTKKATLRVRKDPGGAWEQSEVECNR